MPSDDLVRDAEDDGRPAKRQRLDADTNSSPAPLQSFSLPAQGQRWPATDFALPSVITSFSYDDQRNLLLPSSGRHQEALRLYAEPPLGADLARGMHEATMRPEGVAEGLDALLDTLLDLPVTPEIDSILSRASVITWRGMMTRLLKAVFATNESDSWDMNAMLVDGTLYLEDHRRSTYFGYAFESWSTRALDQKRSADGWGGGVNTNVQWCAITKGKLGSLRLVLGGEVDALLERPQEGKVVDTASFVELKTNVAIERPQQEVSFEKFKLLSMYLQSFLLGVRTIVVGFRTRSGELQALQTFSTLEIPRLVRSKPHAWDPLAALAVGHDIATFIRDTIAGSPAQQAVSKQFDQIASADTAAALALPVFRVHFDGAARQITIRAIEEHEHASLVVEAGRAQRERNGFLPREWVVGIKERLLRMDKPVQPA